MQLHAADLLLLASTIIPPNLMPAGQMQLRLPCSSHSPVSQTVCLSTTFLIPRTSPATARLPLPSLPSYSNFCLATSPNTQAPQCLPLGFTVTPIPPPPHPPDSSDINPVLPSAAQTPHLSTTHLTSLQGTPPSAKHSSATWH